MFQQAIWFGLSLALHCAVAVCLVMSASRDNEKTPKPIMVVLDNFEYPHAPVREASRTTMKKELLPTTPERAPEPAVKNAQTAFVQPSTPLVQPGAQAHESPAPTTLTKAPTASLQKVEYSIPSVATLVNKSAQQVLSVEDQHPSTEKTQQKYFKENFAYIRDLITTRLVYPPTARRMNWSGKVVVTFIVAEDGAVHSIRIVETSGHTILDKSAMETVRSVAPFPKPPVRAEITVPVYFKLMP